jgi:hypothetical protein
MKSTYNIEEVSEFLKTAPWKKIENGDLVFDAHELRDWLKAKLTQAHSAGVEEGRTAGVREEREKYQNLLHNIKTWAAERIYRAVNPTSTMCVPNAVYDYIDKQFAALPTDRMIQESEIKPDTSLQSNGEGRCVGCNEVIKHHCIDYCGCPSGPRHAPKSEGCCEKCYSTYTEKDWPSHTVHDACINRVCPCHQQ